MKQQFFDRLHQLYLNEAYNSAFWQRQTFFGDFIVDCPTCYMTAAMAGQGIPTYNMIFNAGDQLHGATAVFILGPNDSPSKQHLSLPDFSHPILMIEIVDANNATISTYMKDWFLSFITDMDPNAST